MTFYTHQAILYLTIISATPLSRRWINWDKMKHPARDPNAGVSTELELRSHCQGALLPEVTQAINEKWHHSLLSSFQQLPTPSPSSTLPQHTHLACASHRVGLSDCYNTHLYPPSSVLLGWVPPMLDTGLISKILNNWTSPGVQGVRICLPMQGTRVPSLIQEDSTCRGASKPRSHNYWAGALEPVSHNCCYPAPGWRKPACPRGRAPQREKYVRSN